MTADVLVGAPRREYFEHDADIGVHGVGLTPDEAFEQAELALTAVITDRPRISTLVEIECAAANRQIPTHMTREAFARLFPQASGRRRPCR